MIRRLLTNGNLSYHFAYLQNVTTFGYVKFYALSGALNLHSLDKTTRQRNDLKRKALSTVNGHTLAIDRDADVILYRLLLRYHFSFGSTHKKWCRKHH